MHAEAEGRGTMGRAWRFEAAAACPAEAISIHVIKVFTISCLSSLNAGTSLFLCGVL